MSGSDDEGATWDPSGSRPAPSRTPGRHRSITQEAPGRYVAESGPEEIGRGGIGRVVLVYDAHLGREVARKELLGGVAGSVGGATPRFLQEARVTAQLEHPNIVPVYELGRAEDGTLYYTMKRVRGRTLADVLAEQPGLDARLRLLDHFVDACQALAYAHSRGVVHRDIKPHNLMIGEFGETIVLDWGLAKVRGEEDIRGGEIARGIDRIADPQAFGTIQGVAMGTPAYMSPEQARGAIDAIDERSDVWSLGAVLYEILVGAPPFVAPTAHDVLHEVREAPPPLVREKRPDAPPELAAIAQKALERDPDERYPTASALAEDVRKWQTGARVDAYGYTPWEATRRLARQYRTALGIGAVALIAVLAVGAVATSRVIEDRDRAMDAELRATRSMRDANARLAMALADAGRRAADEGRATDAWMLATAALALDDTPEGRGAAVAARSGTIPVLGFRGVGCERVVVSPEGDALACSGLPGVVLLGRDGEPRRVAMPRTSAIAWGPGGRIAAVSGDEVVVLDAGTGERGATLDVVGAGPLAWLPDGTLAIGATDGHLRVWDDDGLRDVALAHDGPVLAIAAAEGRVATSGTDGRTRLWTPEGSPVRGLSTRGGALALAFAPDGTRIAAGGDARGSDGRIQVFDAGTGASVAVLDGHTGEVASLSWPTPDRLVSGASDGTVRLWSPADGRSVAVLPLPGRAIVSVGATADGTIAAADDEDVVSLWAIGAPHADRLVGHRDAVTGVAWADVGTVVTSSRDGVLRTWDVGSGAVTDAVALDGRGLGALATAGGRTFLGDEAGIVHAREPDGRFAWRAALVEGPVVALAASERWVAAAGDDGRVHVAGVADGVQIGAVKPMDPHIAALAFEPSGERVLAVGRETGWVTAIDAAKAEGAARAEGDVQGLRALAFAPDGATLATGGSALRLWTATDGGLRLARELGHHDGPIEAIAFAPDGAIVASGGADRRVRVWDVASGALLATLDGHDHRVTALAFSPDGARLASASADRTVRLWAMDGLDTPPGSLAARAGRETGLRVEGTALAVDPTWSP